MIQIETKYKIHGYMDSRIGGRDENQDSCGFADTVIGFLAVVCDGMGGAQGGSTASSLAVSTVLSDVQSSDGVTDPAVVLKEAVLHANQVVIETGMKNPSLVGMGTTLTAVLINDECAYLTHIGDSRIYQLRGRKKVFRTFDDSMVFQMVRSGVITEEEARTTSNSNIILKAIGITSDLDVNIVKRPYDKGDRFVLCTDGFWGNMPEPEFLDLLTKGGELELMLERAFGKVERAGVDTKGGHHDNLSCLMFETSNNSKFRSKMEKKLLIASIALAALLCLSFAINLSQGSNVRKLEKDLEEKGLAYDQSVEEANNAKTLAEDAGKRAEQSDINARNADAAKDKAVQERKVAETAKNKAVQEKQAAERAKDNALKEKQAAESVKDNALKEKEDAERAKDNALKEKEAAERAKNKAIEEKKEVETKLKEANESLEKLKEKIDNLNTDVSTLKEKNKDLSRQIQSLKKQESEKS